LETQESKNFLPMFLKHLPYLAIASVCKETGLASEVGISNRIFSSAFPLHLHSDNLPKALEPFSLLVTFREV
jgi:hypothetical protein